MSTVRAIRQSNLARLGTYALDILLYAIYLYAIYVLATLLEFGFGGLAVEPTARRLLGSTGLFIIGLGLVRWFFETKVGS